MSELLRLLNLPCREIAALVSAELDTNLTRAQRWAVRIHLLYCGACRSYQRHIRLLRRLLEAAREQLLSGAAPPREPAGRADTLRPVLSPEARQRIQRALSTS